MINFKTLIASNGEYIQTAKLYLGLFTSSIPDILMPDVTIEMLLDQAKNEAIARKVRDIDKYLEVYNDNLKYCSLVDLKVDLFKNSKSVCEVQQQIGGVWQSIIETKGGNIRYCKGYVDGLRRNNKNSAFRIVDLKTSYIQTLYEATPTPVK